MENIDNKKCCEQDCKCGGNIPKHRMCQLTKNAHNFDLENVKELTSSPKYIYKCCGRTANNSENLCSPELLH